MACSRASGVISTVQMLLKNSGKDARLTMDKVTHSTKLSSMVLPGPLALVFVFVGIGGA